MVPAEVEQTAGGQAIGALVVALTCLLLLTLWQAGHDVFGAVSYYMLIAGHV